ncbi:hypothetical protein Ciccas_006442 [Cichlidogyrus casuarinus]|uniref:Uncharacterized protein n=1 Tax=Cichlidogyrus casuarinus TaxID=1844966 RepID=A0ABD2Q5S2_9PLAT
MPRSKSNISYTETTRSKFLKSSSSEGEDDSSSQTSQTSLESDKTENLLKPSEFNEFKPEKDDETEFLVINERASGKKHRLSITALTEDSVLKINKIRAFDELEKQNSEALESENSPDVSSSASTEDSIEYSQDFQSESSVNESYKTTSTHVSSTLKKPKQNSKVKHASVGVQVKLTPAEWKNESIVLKEPKQDYSQQVKIKVSPLKEIIRENALATREFISYQNKFHQMMEKTMADMCQEMDSQMTMHDRVEKIDLDEYWKTISKIKKHLKNV